MSGGVELGVSETSDAMTSKVGASPTRHVFVAGTTGKHTLPTCAAPPHAVRACPRAVPSIEARLAVQAAKLELYTRWRRAKPARRKLRGSWIWRAVKAAANLPRRALAVVCREKAPPLSPRLCGEPAVFARHWGRGVLPRVDGGTLQLYRPGRGPPLATLSSRELTIDVCPGSSKRHHQITFPLPTGGADRELFVEELSRWAAWVTHAQSK